MWGSEPVPGGGPVKVQLTGAALMLGWLLLGGILFWGVVCGWILLHVVRVLSGLFPWLIAVLVLLLPSICFGQTNITDPAGNEWSYNTPLWHYWRGFGVGCVFILFAFVKRLAMRSGSHTEF